MLLFLFHVHGYFTHIFLSPECSTKESRSGSQTPWNRSYRQLWSTLWVLGSEAGSSVGSASVLDCWVVSPAPSSVFCRDVQVSGRLWTELIWGRSSSAQRYWDKATVFFPERELLALCLWMTIRTPAFFCHFLSCWWLKQGGVQIPPPSWFPSRPYGVRWSGYFPWQYKSSELSRTIQ